MKRSVPSKALLLLILNACLVSNPVLRAQKIFFEQLTVAEGLPSDYVNTIFQDSKGDLWFGTDKGACCYNGERFSYFTRDNGLTSNFIYCIAEDPRGNIWFGTFEGGVCKYDGQKITPFPLKDTNEFKNVYGILFNNDGSFFVESGNFHTYFFRDEQSAPEKLPLKGPMRLSPASNDGFLVSSGNTTVYFMTRHGNQFSFRPIWRSHNKEELLLGRPYGDHFMIQATNTLLLYDAKSNNNLPVRTIKLPGQLPFGYEKSFYMHGNEIWIGSYKGLLFVDAHDRTRYFTVDNGLSGNYVNTICEDRQNNIYICTFGGGVRIWPRLYLASFPIEGKVNSIFPGANSAFITTTRSVYNYSPRSGLVRYDNLRFDNFCSIYQSENGEICLGTYTGFLRLPGEASLRHLDNHTRKKYENLTQVGISGFRMRKDGRLFVSMYGEGVYLYDQKNRIVDSFTRKNNRLGSGLVEFLKPLKNSLAALTYSAGLTMIDSNGRTTIIDKRDGLLSNTVFSVYKENKKDTWIGTLNGLNLCDGKKISKTFSSQDGFIGNRAICIFRDPKQRIWVLSDKYLHLLDDDKLRAIRSYPLLFDDKNSINRAEYDTASGMLYLGMNDAFLVVDISKIVPDTLIRPPLLFAATAGEDKIVFQFAARSYSIAQRSDIYYKLAGYDEDWKLLDRSAELTYQKLPAGQFELLARSVNPDGYGSSQVSLYRFRILPPFWRRWWFLALSLAGLLTLVFFASTRRSRKKYERRIGEIQEMYKLQLERERIARELHDHVGSQLTYLINKIEDGHSLLADKAEVDKLGNFARGAMRDLRETIWALDKKEILPDEMENKIRQLARLYKDKGHLVEMDWQVDNQSLPPLKSLEALNIYRIIQEALNNAMKYSGASLIAIRVFRLAGGLDIQIGDNGKGFDALVIEKGYGLKNIQRRAEEMNAEITLETGPGKGTLVKLWRRG